MDKVAIISSGYFPVPAVMGGAVETLVERMIDSNELDKYMDLTVYSTFNDKAYAVSKKYKNTTVKYIHDHRFIEKIDLVIYKLAKKIIKSDKHMSFRYIAHRIAYILSVSKMISKESYDYIIIENTATLFWTIKLHGNYKRYKGKYIYHLHNIIGNTFGCKKIIQESKSIWGVSEYINATVKDEIPEIKEENMAVLYNMIDIQQIEMMKKNRYLIRKKFGFSEKDIVCIFVGRLCRDKGIEEVLEAFNMIESSKVKLLIVGNYYFGTNLESDFEIHLKNLLDKKRDLVKFTGFVPNSEIGSYYFGADMAVLPSIWEEPAGLTMIEAMAASLPVITTNSGGIPEYVGKENAIILDKNSNQFVYDIKTNIEYLAGDEAQRKKLGKKARERVEKFDSGKYIKSIYDLI